MFVKNKIDQVSSWSRNSLGLKVFVIGFLVLILLIPASMIESLIREREITADETINEVSANWGAAQVLAGPILSVPYIDYFKDEYGVVRSQTKYAHFLPENLNINGDVGTEIRNRGIYSAVLYNTQLEIDGNFLFPDFDSLVSVAEKDILYQDAFISFGLTDMRGINENISINFDSENFVFEPGVPINDVFNSGFNAEVLINKKANYKFSMQLDLNGSFALNFAPLGKTTTVNLTSSWNNPSFDGAFLPDTRTITEEGFSADWKILHLNRNYPQQWIGSANPINLFSETGLEPSRFDNKFDYYDESSDLNNVNDYSFGVKLLLPVDAYQKSMRAIKYVIMTLVLTFVTFFFVEVFNKKKIHPVQYLLVGFAVCIFYLLLLSLSEHLAFGLAYLIASLATILLISFYSKTVFDNSKQSKVLGGILVLMYGFFYTLLQLQDYALLVGSIGLFAVLAIVMMLSRKIDWYGNVN